MGRDSLEDIDSDFYRDLEKVIIIGVKSNQTVNVRTNIYDKQEFRDVLTTALIMSVSTDFKNLSDGVDNLH